MKKLSEVRKTIVDSSKVIGLKQSLKAIDSGSAGCVVLSTDCDQSIIDIIEYQATQNKVKLIKKFTMEELGEICNIEVACSVVTILK